MIKISNLHKHFGELEVLKGIDLEISKGEVVAIIGSSGTGKSTLLRCMNYLETPDEGTITIGDITVEAGSASKAQIHELRKHSAMIFQNYNLFLNKDVLHNVMEPLISAQGMKEPDAKERAIEYLNKVGMGDKLSQYPSTLSGGQQQRVAIARSLAIQPNVLLFDEPTSALDPEWVQEVLEVIRKLAEAHYTMIIVTHEMQFARDVADRVVFMDGGKIVEDGPAAQVIDNPQQERTRAFLKKSNAGVAAQGGQQDKTPALTPGFSIVKSKNFKDMLPMFIEAGLEFAPDAPDPEGLLVCFEMFDNAASKRMGGACLAYECDEYVVRAVAIDPAYQSRGLGRELVEQVISEARQWGAMQIYLNAKVPGFYKKLGFEIVPVDEAPAISECHTCSRYHVSCGPEIMRLTL